MAQYSWATDIHLDFLSTDQQRLIRFAESLVVANPTGVFLTGDISVARQLVYHLSVIERVVQRPIYFVLGNHDFYGGAIEPIRKAMRELSNVSPFLRYMPTMPYYSLSSTTCVVGHDGWADALVGDWQTSTFGMTDWTAIHDFLPVNGTKATIVAQMRKLAHEGVTHMMTGIKQAVRYHKQIVLLTHYPPFMQSHIHEGKPGDKNATPWFVSKMCGDMLMDAAKAFPTVNFNVLCGHTHGKSDLKILDNLAVHVGGAEYNNPVLQGLIEVV